MKPTRKYYKIKFQKVEDMDKHRGGGKENGITCGKQIGIPPRMAFVGLKIA
jgi:hypothetical protein